MNVSALFGISTLMSFYDAFPSAGVLLETCDRGITCLAAYSSGTDCLANVSPVNTVVRL